MAKEAVPHARGRGSDAEAAGLDNAGSSRGYEDVARCLTAIALACLVAAAALLNPWFLLAGLVAGYAFAWVAHFFVEHNSALSRGVEQRGRSSAPAANRSAERTKG